ncbi:MAG: GNAT family N-acetyltransferase [Deinococcota bacterium]
MDVNVLELKTIFEPDQAVIDAVDNGLETYNFSKVGGWTCDHLAIIAEDNKEKIIGGLYGVIQWDWLEIELAWVDETYRSKGLGSKLVSEAEAAAVSKGVQNVHLRTGSWQAVDFYKKLGYAVFGQLEDYPKGFTTYFMRKSL